jgi:putative SOS response-associated peptidase YedK
MASSGRQTGAASEVTPKFVSPSDLRNAAPSQELLVIRRNHQIGDVSLDPLRWGLIPYWCNDPTGGRKPINAKCETVRDLPTFREAYRKRRCIGPVDGFFEWKAIKSQKAKQPYAIAMRDGTAFGIAGIWENWKDPSSGEWTRTFAIITTEANELVADIHDRMPVLDSERPNPPPDRELLINAQIAAPLLWAVHIGCPKNCTHCSMVMAQKLRARTYGQAAVHCVYTPMLRPKSSRRGR